VVRNTKALENAFDDEKDGLVKRSIDNFKKSVNQVTNDREVLSYFRKIKENSTDNLPQNKRKRGN
jgi:hypothetical protein